MVNDIPPPVAAMVRSINDGDTTGFLDLFTADGVVDDWGKIYRGRDEIETWSDRELIGAKGILTVGSVKLGSHEVELVGDWKSNYFTGEGKFIFSIRDGKVSRWLIRGR